MLYRFNSFELDVEKGELRADGSARSIEPQVFSLLALLVENRERLVSRGEILEKVWDGRVVSDAALDSRIKSARRVLGDDGRGQRFIRTIHGRGFRFVSQVDVERFPVAAGQASGSSGVEYAEIPARPSIAVLPFRTVGEAHRLAAIAEGLPDELIAELSRLRWLFVTARGSSFRLRGSDADAGEIGRLLGVRYCMSGTVELSGSRLAATVELVDARDQGVVWAERFCGPIDDVHAIREGIRARVLSALEIRIPLHEASLARLTASEDLDAWSAYHLGLQHLYHYNRHDNAAAAALFEHALARDSGFARAHAGLSFAHFQTVFLRYADDPGRARALARRCAERGMELDPIDPFVNFTLGRSFWLEGDLESSLGWFDRAIAISPNYAQGIYARAWADSLAGRGLEARAQVDLAMRLSPLDPLYYAMLGTRAFSHMALGEDGEAATWAERAARSPGAHVLIAMIAAGAHAMAGDRERAATWAANVRSRNAELTRDDFFRSFPMKPEAMRERVAEALTGLGF